MPKEYTPEQKWKLFDKLPKDLQDAIFSVETADSVYSICEKNEIDQVSKVAKIIGDVLLGLLPLDDLQETLEKELKLKPELAKKIFQEADRFIFYYVKKSLNDIYGKENSVPIIETEFTVTEPKLIKQEPAKPASAELELKILKSKSNKKPDREIKKISQKDVYRETVE